MQLAVANVDGIDSFGSSLQEDIGESACGGAQIGAHKTVHLDTEGDHGRLELVTPANHILWPLAYPDFDVHGYLVARFRGRLIVTNTAPLMIKRRACSRLAQRFLVTRS